MIQEILFAFNKLDYFRYIFLFFILFIFIKNFDIINPNNIISIVFAGLIMYFLINRKVLQDYSKLNNINKDLISLNIDKYKNIAQEIEVINYLVKLQYLIKVNRVKFNSFMKHVDNFFYCYKISFNKNERPTTIYDIAKDESKISLNTLSSFYIDLDIYPNLNVDREFTRLKIHTDKADLEECIDKFKYIFTRYLNEMEVNINSDWLKGKINTHSKPVYPDEPDPSILNNSKLRLDFDKHYDLY